MQRRAAAAEHPLRRPADAEQDVDPGRGVGGGQRPADVSVGDEADPRAGRAHLGDQRRVARAIEDHGGQIAHLDPLGLGDGGEVVRGAPADVDRAAGLGADGDLVHVGVGGVEELAVLGHRDHGQRVGRPVRDQVRPLQGIDGDVDLRRVGGAVPDRLADVEHRRLVALPFADDDPAAQVHEAERLSHRLRGRAVGALPIAASDEAGGRQRRRLGYPNDLESQVSVHPDIVTPAATKG